MVAESNHPARYWHTLDDGRIECDLCPRTCRLHEGQRAACFVRQMDQGQMVLTTWGRSSGFCIDPIEKKPLNHFYPGSKVLSFGTAGCNLACKFCQNWDISKSRDMDRLMDTASPEAIARAAEHHGCRSVAFTYNDPVIIHGQGREDFFRHVDAANVDLKAFSEDFYVKLTGAHLEPVLDTLRWLRQETSVWVEITTLLIPGKNDSDTELEALSDWIVRTLGPDVPLHFTAFHPDYKLDAIGPTPLTTLQRARRIAMTAGIHYVYTGNVRDLEGATTFCPGCRTPLIVRDGYRILDYALTPQGRCPHCDQAIAGRFGPAAEDFGNRRIPVRIAAHAP